MATTRPNQPQGQQPSFWDNIRNNQNAMGGIAGLGAGLGSLFMGGGKNPADSANDYFNQIPGVMKPYFDPWINQGLHPGETINDIGKNYQQSPGYKFAMQQALQGGQHMANAGGMSGSPQAQQQGMQLASDIASQDYNNWMQNALGVRQTGQQASTQLGENLGSNLSQQGQYAYGGQAGQNQADSQMWGNIFGGAAALLPFLL